MIPAFFIVTIIFIGWIYYEKTHSDRIMHQQKEAFWEKETRANLTRKADISGLNYITVPLERLPLHENCDEDLAQYEDFLRKLASKKIVNFTGTSNTDLKLTYGAPNIDFLKECDQNYLELVRTLYRYGKLLYERGNREEAKSVLEYGLEIGTDISANYTLLATIYKEENAVDRIDFVIECAEKLNSMTKNALLNSLHQLLL